MASAAAPRPQDAALTRLGPIVPERTALLLVDVQNSEISEEYRVGKPEYWRAIMERALPNQQRLVAACRAAGIEVIYTVIESLTRDGRDRSLDHKLSGILILHGSPLARVIDTVAPAGDEIVLPKTSSGVFNSTVLDYLLRNLGIETLLVAGFLTDQCVDMAVRDGADRGYYMICVADACAAHTAERHETALEAFGGYCRTMQTAEVLAQLPTAAPAPVRRAG